MNEGVYFSDIRTYKFFTKKNYEVFLKNVESEGGFTTYGEKLDRLLKYLDGEDIFFLISNKYGISPLIKNADLFDELGDMVFRGNGWMLKDFMDIRKTKGTEVWKIWEKTFWDKLNATKSNEFEIAAEKLRKIGVNVEKSDFGMSPDFRLTPEHLFQRHSGNKSIEFGGVRIKMSGSRALDEQAAFEKVKLDGAEAYGFTWHHLDDFDPVTGECTVQLVRTPVHSCIEHTGAVRMWELFYGGEANKRINYAS